MMPIVGLVRVPGPFACAMKTSDDPPAEHPPAPGPTWPALVLNTLLLAAVGAALVWGPLWWHYRVVTGEVAPAVVDIDRRQPSDEVLTMVADASMMTDHPLRGDAAVAVARGILRGELALPYLPPLPVDLDFAEADLERGVPVQQLYSASLIVPDMLLRAYEHTRDPAFLHAARRYLRGFIASEAAQWFPTGLLRNAHAVVNRAAVLARFWKLVRADADAATDAEVHLHARRLAALLAKPSLFIAGSNHGVMQNLALLQLSTAFPALPEAAESRRLALQRLERQLPFYIGQDGAVLEHSAGYHFHGVVLTGFMQHVLRAAGEPVPPALAAAHGAALAFFTDLQRPDRTMPLLGNTYRYRWSLPPMFGGDDLLRERELGARESFAHLFPVSGHAVWWSRESAARVPVQLVVPWGHFAAHGHRRAQDLSLHLWADGVDWSTASGYWPSGDGPGVQLSNGWDGGNGPHLVGESADSRRRTVLRAEVQHGDLRLLDLERRVDGGPRLRRQILQWQGSTVLVLDSHEAAAGSALRVLWTAAPETEQRALGPRRFGYRRPGSNVELMLAVDGSEGIGATPLKGSLSPFGGWVAFDRRAWPAPGVDARLPQPGGWMLTTLALVPGDAASAAPASMRHHAGAEDWEIQLGEGADTLRLRRSGMRLSLEHDGSTETVELQPGPDVSAEIQRIERAGEALRTAFPRVRTLEPERRRASLALAGLWVALAAGPWAVRRRRRAVRRATWLGVNATWLAAALWIAFVHLRA
ncbi:MAG: hypothetical protein KF788_03595 [Piscinibacter sp.]|nr:hypothetical protein [Piscinibacter sp.]